MMIEGRLSEGVSMDIAENAINEVVKDMVDERVDEQELTKVKNKIEAYITFGEVNVLNRVMSLAYFDMLGQLADVNREVEKYSAVTAQKLQEAAADIFREDRSNTIRYFSNN